MFMQTISVMSKNELLKRARDHYFSLGVKDGAADLCQWNYKYGLAKIHFAQEKLGISPNATFISTPDETISRNQIRWRSGYGYGGKLTWNDREEKLIFVDTKPNACGMLVGGLDHVPSPVQILENVNKTMTQDTYIDDVKVKWDFKKGNHFIDVFKIESAGSRAGLPRYAFIIHGSCPELRDANEKGPGLYYDVSKTLMDMCRRIETPFGPILYLEGADAKEYLEYYEYAKWFAAQKREKVARLLFGKFLTISNPVHQGLYGYSSLLLGAQSVKEPGEKLFPLALRSDLPAYLVTGRNNLTDEVIINEGFEKRAKDYGIYHRLANFNALPHGGGYVIPHICRVLDVTEVKGERYFVCEQENEDAITVLSDPKESQFNYRGKKVVKRMLDLDLGNVEFKLYPRFILKV